MYGSCPDQKRQAVTYDTWKKQPVQLPQEYKLPILIVQLSVSILFFELMSAS